MNIQLTICRNRKTDKLSLRRSDGHSVEYMCIDGDFADEKDADKIGVFEWEERRQRTPEAAQQTEREKFEAWYTLVAFDITANPIGSRDCHLQWVAWWQRALEAHPPKPEPTETHSKSEYKRLSALGANVVPPKVTEKPMLDITDLMATDVRRASAPKPTEVVEPSIYLYQKKDEYPILASSRDEHLEKQGYEAMPLYTQPTVAAPKPTEEWMDAAANDIGKLFQNRWERAYMEPVMPQEIEAIISEHYSAPAGDKT